jgi:lipoprotein-anchoring transpeptidase ErfK/SrfK
MRLLRRVLLIALTVGAPACGHREDPPGAGARPESAVVSASAGASAALDSSGEPVVLPPTRGAPPKEVLGTVSDNLPFEPTGEKLASIAWRNWVYTDVGPQRTRLGYLRAGAIVDVRGPAIVNDGCDGGWYRVNPRGFICVGKGATKDLRHPVVVGSEVRAVRGQGLPYVYAMAGDTPPLLYFRLPKKDEMKHVEGDGVLGQALRYKQQIAVNGLLNVIGTPGPPPAFLSTSTPIEKPYGTTKRLHFSVHAGRAATDSGFAIARVFEHEGRIWGLTTELDIIALDRTHVVRPSAFHGVELGPDETLPVAFIERRYAQKYKESEGGQLVAAGNYGYREPIKLTGKTKGQAGTFYETRDGYFMAADGARIMKPRTEFPSFATGTRKWVDISIRDQSLVAYVGQKPVYVTLVSSGRGGMGDPEKVPATVRGTFMIYSKHVSATMDNEEDKADSFALLDVPFVQYFHKGYALHGTYWHDEFGKIRSHGCVNLAPIDAAWLFEWTDPPVPADWHGVINKERGTVVLVRP